MVDTLPAIRACYFRKSPRPPPLEKVRRAGHYDSIRTPHLRSMADPARTHPENCPHSLCPGPRIFFLCQLEFHRHSKIDLHTKPRFCAFGSAGPRRSATPAARASSTRPATLPSSSLTPGCFSVFGSSAVSTRSPAHPPWPNSVPPFPAAAANIISLGALSATTLDSSSVGATGSPPAAPPPPFPWSSPNTAATFSPYSPATHKSRLLRSPLSADSAACNGAVSNGAAVRSSSPPP